MHCDLKCANVLVDKDGSIRLSDFGCSQIMEQSLSCADEFQNRVAGTWMAPEVIMAENAIKGGYEI